MVNLNKEGARVDYYFSSICKVNEKYNIDIFHNAKKTISNVYNKCISIDSGNINFIINSYVYKDNIKCKSLLDRVCFDHVNKKIILIDLKTTVNVYDFAHSVEDFVSYRQIAYYGLAL